MKKITFLLCSILISVNILAQWSDLNGTSNGTNNLIWSICSDGLGNIYAAGYFTNSNGKKYVAKFNGTNWSELGGTNTLAANSYIQSVCSDGLGNIYAAGWFTNSSGKYYVAKFNGTSWSELGGTNALAANNPITSICFDASGNIYAAGNFTNSSGKYYVAKFNGTSWSELGGTSSLAANGPIWSLCSDASGNICAAGDFTNSNVKNYVAKWNGTSWSELGGTNALAANGRINSICKDASGNIYVGGEFSNGSGKYYVAKFYGTTWSELGGINTLAANSFIRSVCSDASGNIYAAGGFQTVNGYIYVAKFNGNIWSVLGGTNALGANGYINSICSDVSGKIYAAGAFTNSSGKNYVAKWKDCPVIPVSINTIGATTFCEGNTVYLYSSKSGNPYTYNWFKDGIHLIYSYGYTVSQSGSYTLEVDSLGGCPTISSATIISVNPSPKVGFTINKPTQQCLNTNSFAFNDTTKISSGTITRIWNFGSGTNDTSSNISPVKVYTTANTYTVKIVETSNLGCKDSSLSQVIVNPNPNTGFTVNKLSQCVNGNNYIFTDTTKISSGTITRLWDFGGQSTTTQINPSFTFANSGTYNIKLVGTSDKGCKDSIVKAITVYPKPNPGFTINKSVQCLENNNFILTDTSKISSGNFNLFWYIDNSFTSNNSSLNKSISTAGVHNIKLVTISNNNCSDSIIKTVNVKEIKASTNITNNTNCSGTCNGSISVNPSGGTAPYTFLWGTNTGAQITQTVSSLCRDNYIVQIKDSMSCILNLNTKILSVPALNSQVSISNLGFTDQSAINTYNYYTYDLPSTLVTNQLNPQNLVNAGKIIRFKSQALNKKTNGQSIVDGSCKIRSADTNILINDSVATLNNIGYNSSVWAADEFEIYVKPNIKSGNNVYLDYIISDGTSEFKTGCISIPVSPLVYSAYNSQTIDDDNIPDSKGNGNHICEVGETIEFYPWLDNVSDKSAQYVLGKLVNTNNGIQVWNNKQGANSIVSSSSWWNYIFNTPTLIDTGTQNVKPAFDFVFDYGNGAPNPFSLNLNLGAGFKLLGNNTISLIQWNLPYNFNSGTTGLSSILSTSQFVVYPNPSTNSLKIISTKSDLKGSKIIVNDMLGKNILEETIQTDLNEHIFSTSELKTGAYILTIQKDGEISRLKFVKE